MDSDLGLFPLNTVLLPGAALRLHIFEDRYKQMMGQCIAEDRPFGVLLDRNGRERGDDLDPVNVGTAAFIHEVTKLPQGRLYIVAHGVRRFRVKELLGTLPFWRAHVSYLNERLGPADSATRLRESAEDTFKDYLQALLRVSGDELEGLVLPPDEAASSYVIAD
ncbi:MAG: LON peptidase substrate-binding domain-containing protein, partial [Candidatus Eremiobacteraeota bacterium]|nr:LON peptidase substrate-binding domain-containing protein [Candidatus Eremiobacteraeota bacterium]